MIGSIHITYKGLVPKGMKGAIAKFQKAAFGVIGIMWHRQFRPRHFTHEGSRLYGYTARKGARGSAVKFKGSYTARKLKAFGHTNPLVFSGLSLRLSKIRDVRATRHGNRVILPTGFNRRNPHSNIDMRAEVTAVVRSEEVKLTKRFDGSLQQQIDRYRKVTKKRIRF